MLDQTLLSQQTAQILMSGHLTETIQLEQGVPQGDVISPYLNILMVEVLLIQIKHTKNLIGIKYARQEARSETFVDDTTIFLTRTESNLRYAKIIEWNFTPYAD